jgi:acyl-coenzyme A synthetase/AMP-(fatty) acid ligase
MTLSIFDHGAPSPPPANFNMARHVLRAGQASPDKLALRILDPATPQDWSYGTLTAAVLGTGSGLLARGLKPGDLLLMRLGNTVDFPIAYLGALAAGLVPVPTSSALTLEETRHIVDDLQPAAILRADGISCPDDHPHIINQHDLRRMRALPPCDFHMGPPDRLGYVIYTSGTSGHPRAVAHAHRAIWARQMMFSGWYGLTAQDTVMHAGAFNWTYTLGTGLMDPWTIGATALIPAPGTAPADLPALLEQSRASIFAAAPGVYRQMLRAPIPPLPHLRHGLSAGEKLSAPLQDAWHSATHTPIFEAFGMSECSTFISASPDRPALAGTLGRPQPGRRVAILGQGGPVPQGTPGMIAVHKSDPGLMLGYLNAAAETAAKFQGDWFLTGDLGQMSADGSLRYLGRADDMMNAGGYRVSPIEVEQALMGHPQITSVGVTDIEIKKDARVIAAFYTGPKALDDADLARYASERLARYKQPRLFIHLPALPVGANGKLLRRALRKTFESPS